MTPVGATQYAAPMAWPEHVSRRMADYIHAEVKEMVSQSRLVRKSDGIALVHRHEILVGELLGRGAFSEVHRIQVAGNHGNGPRPTFAMKHLKQKLMSQPDNFRLAASELAVEAHMLASFDHPNIISIHGWAANGVASFTQGGHDSFFLLLDCLDETLDCRIQRWQKQQQHNAHHIQQQHQEQQMGTMNMVADLWRRFSHNELSNGGHMSGHGVLDEEWQLLFLEKLGIVTEIAAALSYLHEKRVIFRDLKPNNIGFLNGRVKLFDFGLSRELPGNGDLSQPFEMSGKVGTLRYMATEVAMHQPYNVSADVYSWAMVAYEVMTLEKPFAGWTRDMHANLVCGRGARPELNTVPLALRSVLPICWDQTPQNRPTMLAVHHKMRLLEEEQVLVLKQHQLHQEQQRLQQQELLQQQQMQQASPNTVVELPRDFQIASRKAPQRNISEAFTRSTLSMSMSGESFAEYQYE